MSTGVIYTETVVHAAPAEFVADAPYQLAIVALEGGGRLTVRIAGERVEIGDKVELSRDAQRRSRSSLTEASSVKVFLYYIGKARDTHANAMAEEYIKRSARFAKCEMREIHPLRFDPWAKHPSARKILLDPAGKTLDSKKLTALFERDMVFVYRRSRRTAAGVESAGGSTSRYRR